MEEWLGSGLARIRSALESFDACEGEIAGLIEEGRERGDTENLRAHVELAAIAVELSEEELALVQLRQALALPAVEADALTLRLRALLLLGQCDAPTDERERALRTVLTVGLAQLPAELVARVLVELGKLVAGDEAIAVFERALQFAVEPAVVAEIRVRAGTVLERLGRLRDAETELRAAIALRSSIDPETVLWAEAILADVLSGLGAHDEARALLETQIAASPSAGAYAALYRVLVAAGDDAAAEIVRIEGTRLAVATLPRDLQAMHLAWLTGGAGGELAVEQLLFPDVDLAHHCSGPIESAQDYGSQRIFGPRRDFTCECGKLTGFGTFPEICPSCRVESLPAEMRRWRMAGLALHTPTLHPRARALAALLLDRTPEEVEVEQLRDLDRFGLEDELIAARDRGQLRGRFHSIGERLEAVRRLREAGKRPEWTFLTTMPILAVEAAPPGVDPLRFVDAYQRLLEANRAGAPLFEPLSAVFECFAPLPPEARPCAAGETHAPPYELPPGTILRPTFAGPDSSFAAGTAFAVGGPGDSKVLLTSLHLLRSPVATLERVDLADGFSGARVGVAGRALPIAGADASVPARDVLAFSLARDHAPFLRLATEALQENDRVYLAGSVRAGAPATQQLHPATVYNLDVEGTVLAELDVPDLDLEGLSGAPLLGEDGTVVGLLSRYAVRGPARRILAIFFVPASALRQMLSGSTL